MITVEALEDRVRVVLPEQCSIYEAQNIKESLINHMSDFSNEVEIDLQNIEELDTTGVQIFLAFKKTLNQDGKNIHFVNPSEKAKTVLDFYNLTTYLG